MDSIKKRKKSRTWTDMDFVVKKSTIPRAGKGLFSLVRIKAGETIGEYTGKILTDIQAENEPYVTSDYLLWVCKNHYILGEGKLSNHTRYINHKTNGNGCIVATMRWKKARIEATKTIYPEQEIFFDYGDYYWE